MDSVNSNFVFSNSFGHFNKDIVVINKSDFNLSFKEIATIEIKTMKDSLYDRIAIGVLVIMLILLNFFGFISFLISFTILVFVLLSIWVLFFLKKEIIYVQIVLCIPKQVFVKVNKNEYELAKDFTSSFTLFRYLNPDLD